MELQKLADDDVGLEVDGMRIGADEGAAEDARRPMRHIVALQRLEQRRVDFGLLRDRDEGDLLLFTSLSQSSAETFSHAGAESTKMYDAVQGKKSPLNRLGAVESRVRLTAALLKAHDAADL